MGAGRLYTSINSGANWTERQPAGAVDTYWESCTCDADGSVLMACVAGGRLYLSTVTIATWAETRPAGDDNKEWRSVSTSSSGACMVTAVYGGRVYVSTNTGANWAEVFPLNDEGSDQAWTSVSVAADGLSMIACCGIGGFERGRVYVSSDSGTSWVETRPTGVDEDKGWWSVGIDDDGTNLIVGVNNGRLYTGTAQVETPVIDPDGGSYVVIATVTLSCATSSATINYTTSGATPTVGSALYSTPFELTSSCTVKAIAFKTGLTDSEVASAVFTITSGTNIKSISGVAQASIKSVGDTASASVKSVSGVV